MKKTVNKVKQYPNALEKQLQILNDHINNFLQHDFTLSVDGKIQNYCLRLKNLFVDLATLQISPVITNIMSKIGNVLQPLTWHSSKISKQKIKSNGSKYQKCIYCQNEQSQKVKKMKRKINKINSVLDQYRQKSNRLTDLLYFLNLNGLDTNQFYRAYQAKSRNAQPPMLRDQNITSQKYQTHYQDKQEHIKQEQETSVKKSRRRHVQYTDFEIDRQSSTRKHKKQILIDQD